MVSGLLATLPAALALGWLLLGAVQAAAYDVQPGDSLWKISHRTGVPVSRIAGDNHLSDPSHLSVGEHLVLPGEAPGTPERVSRDDARQLLVAAAQEFGVNPNFVLAVAWWESGYDQTQISKDGAVGLMQLLPGTAQWAGPALLGRPANILLAQDNARLGAALLRRYLDEFHDPKLALAAYYQGERGTREHGVYPSSQHYVDGIWALRNRLQGG